MLAQVTTIAGELGVNIEDLEIHHSQYRPRGVLILTVAAEAAERVRHSLGEHGFGLVRPGGRRPVVTIDGPAGAGKSTVAKEVARRLGLERLDTGAMYRAVTLLALESGIDVSDPEACAGIARAMELSVGERVVVNGEDVTEQIRTPEVNDAVSVVAAHRQVREELVGRQRAWVVANGGGVVEGRDIGSVVLPDADLKIFLTADSAARAERRAAEETGGADLAVTAESIRRRDELDSTRPVVAARSSAGRDRAGLDGSQCRLGRGGGALQAVKTPVAAPAPPTRGDLIIYHICRFIAVGVSRLYFPGTVMGRENLPAGGAFIVAPVHRSYVDWLIVARITRRQRLRYIVKEEVWKSKLIGRILTACGAFPVNRSGADREALQRCQAVLMGGEPLVMFPEGTRRSGPVIEDLKDGVAYLALRAGVAVVPVGIGGSERAMPRGSSFPRPRRVNVVIGAPVRPPEPPRPTGPDDADESGAAMAPRRARVGREATTEHSRRVEAAIQQAFDAAEASLRR